MLVPVKLTEVAITWELTADPKEEERVDTEVGRVLRIALPWTSRILFADSEGIRLLVDSTIVSELKRLLEDLHYVSIDFEEVKG